MNSTMAEKQWFERGPPRLAPWFGAGGEAMQIGHQQGNPALFATELEPVGPGKSGDLLAAPFLSAVTRINRATTIP
jgi:hypothetical protein